MKKIYQGMLFMILAGWICLAHAEMTATSPDAPAASATALAPEAPAPSTPVADTHPAAPSTPVADTNPAPPSTPLTDTKPATPAPVAAQPDAAKPDSTKPVAVEPTAELSKCPCDFNQEEFKKFTASMKRGGFICTAQNTRVIGMEDNKPFLSIAMELSAVDKEKRDAANATSDKDALAAASTSWGMVYTSLDNVDPKFKVRICSKNLAGDRQNGFQTATQLDNFTQYQSCLKDILSLAAVLNIPCGI